MKNIEQTFLAQYANSSALYTIIKSMNAALDPNGLIELFLERVWNPDTATGWGLDIWGRIVGVGRVMKVPTDAWFGFAQADDGSGTSLPFNDGFFYTGTSLTNNYRLTDDVYRKLVFAKALSNITNGSIAGLNAILMTLFSMKGRIWVSDTTDMTMTLVHDFSLSPVDATIITTSGVLPRPSGVYFRYQPHGI